MNGEERADARSDEARLFVKYTLLHLRPEWRRLAASEREAGRKALLERLEHPPDEVVLRTYSVVGTKAGAEMLLWMISAELEPVQTFHANLFGGPMGGYLDTAYSYLGMSRRSEYLGAHAHADQEGAGAAPAPADLPYLFVYPFAKQRVWYALPFEERRRIMGEHFRIGHKFPGIRIHTGYSFGLDDCEFILAFESSSPAEFLDLVQELRPSEASRYTSLETPIFTALRVPPRRLVELAEGLP